MPPKLPADHPTPKPGPASATPQERADYVRPARDREGVASETGSDSAIPPAEERRSETLMQDLAAAASPFVPEAGVAEAPTGAGRRNRLILPLCVGAVLLAAILLLWLAT